jgi:replication initiation protein RepC
MRNTMENLNIYEPPVGGRINSPKFRGAAQLVSDFAGLPKGVTRFDLLKLVKRTGPFAGFSSKMTQLLEYYILFTRDSDWTANGRPIVYQALSKTALDFGVSERQVQRWEQDLFNVGALMWNDSGNHRRYGVRDENGEIMYAFGVDLTPLASLREALALKLQEKERLDAAWMETKRQISWYRRQINSLISEAAEYPHLNALRWETEPNYDGIAGAIRTYISLPDLQTLLQAHKDLHSMILKAVRNAENNRLDAEIVAEQASLATGDHNQLNQEMSSRDDISVAYIYSTKQTSSDKSDLSSQADKEASPGSVVLPVENTGQDPASGDLMLGKASADIAEELSNITLKQIVYAASSRFTAMLPRGKARDFADVVDTAYRMLPVLGINKSAWAEACSVLGRQGAAICVMIIDQKAQDPTCKIRNPGGYLREMAARAKRGELHLHRSVFGLLKRGERNHDA